MPALLPDPSGDRRVTAADIDRLSGQIAELTAAIERHETSLKMGLTRMGQLQADIDRIRSASAKLKTGT
jgi:hypothetical protein